MLPVAPATDGPAAGNGNYTEAAAQPLAEVTYTPEPALRRPGRLLRNMVADLIRSRELAWRLFTRDVRAQFRTSYLGYLWLVLPPVVATLMFSFLNSQSILNVAGTRVPYPVFVLTGVMLWEGFAAAFWAPSGAVSGAAGMLTKLSFPREALLVAALYSVLFNLAIKLLLLVPMFAWFGVALTPFMLLAPLGVFGVVVLGFALGLGLVPLTILVPDVGRGLGVLMTGWMLITPVVYPTPSTWPATLINRVNPVSPVLVAARDLITGFPPSFPYAAPLVVAASGALLVFGWVLFRVSLPHIVARMSA